MPLTPFAAVQMSIAGGGNVSGGQVIAGGQTVQLSGTNTSSWVTQLWEIYDYPAGFATPAGWTLTASGILQSTAVTPPVFTPPVATTLWGKYLFRLTINGGVLNGVLMGPGSLQPQIDIASAIHVLSPSGQHDVAVGETTQFDTQRMSIGEYKTNLRILETINAPLALLADFASTTSTSAQSTNLSIPVGASDVGILEWGGNWSLASGASGAKAAILIPASATIEGVVLGTGATLQASQSARLSAGGTLTANAFNTVAATVAAFEGFARIKMNGTAGNLVFQCAPVGAVVLTVKAGAWMRWRRVTEV